MLQLRQVALPPYRYELAFAAWMSDVPWVLVVGCWSAALPHAEILRLVSLDNRLLTGSVPVGSFLETVGLTVQDFPSWFSKVTDVIVAFMARISAFSVAAFSGSLFSTKVAIPVWVIIDATASLVSCMWRNSLCVLLPSVPSKVKVK